MAMKVEIVSRETIIPSSPTPHHLRTFKLSILDQFAPPVYVPIILFYPTPINESYHLKKSLSETLTNLYPYAGRVKDGFFIDCSDQGAEYIEANIADDMSPVLEQPDIDQLQQLLPCDPHGVSTEPSTQVILAVQVNTFGCGGMAIGLCIWHVIADASSTATFVNSWAANAHGAKSNDVENFIFDGTSLFRPQDLSDLWRSVRFNESMLPKIVTKRFVFDGSKIAALRERVGNGSCLERPTRVEAVSALIWGAAIAAAQEGDESVETHVALNAVDLRKRMNPALHQHSIGNIYQVTTAEWPGENTIDYNGLVGKLRESIRKVTDEYVRKLHADGGYLNYIKHEVAGSKSCKKRELSFSSWCRFPFYEADFGWGKPIWVGTALRLKNVAIFMDTSNGEGIEAWLGMSEEDMAKFEQNIELSAMLL